MAESLILKYDDQDTTLGIPHANWIPERVMALAVVRRAIDDVVSFDEVPALMKYKDAKESKNWIVSEAEDIYSFKWCVHRCCDEDHIQAFTEEVIEKIIAIDIESIREHLYLLRGNNPPRRIRRKPQD